jgi:hypothetical protein
VLYSKVSLLSATTIIGKTITDVTGSMQKSLANIGV